MLFYYLDWVQKHIYFILMAIIASFILYDTVLPYNPLNVNPNLVEPVAPV